MTRNVQQLAGKKILFATIPGEGHTYSLTGLAKYLQQSGCDVRWYSADLLAESIRDMGFTHYPYKAALQLEKFNFDMVHHVSNRSREYYTDLKEIYKYFPFDVIVTSVLFSGLPAIREKLKVPIVAAGILPLAEQPGTTRPKENILTTLRRFFKEKILHNRPAAIPYNEYYEQLVKEADLVLQSGSPGFEYPRRDMGRNIRFVGPLLPYDGLDSRRKLWSDPRLRQFRKIILVTQGAADPHVHDLILPTLEAFRDTDVLVIATTGGHDTHMLRERFPDNNMIIEDFIPFGDVMPYANVFVTNGGYSGVLMSIQHKLPMVAAGTYNGRNEICARIGYFKYGINLGTETPHAKQIREAVEDVMQKAFYSRNVTRLSQEFASYNPNLLSASYINDLLITS